MEKKSWEDSWLGAFELELHWPRSQEVSPLWSDGAKIFYAAFGHDGIGHIGTEVTINSGDMAGILMIAVQALEKCTAELKQKEARIAVLESRLEALELRNNHSIQLTAAESLSDNLWQN